MKVYLTIENDTIGEVEGKLIECNLEEMKHIVSQWDKKSDNYSYNSNVSEHHQVQAELYEGSDLEWEELYNYVESL